MRKIAVSPVLRGRRAARTAAVAAALVVVGLSPARAVDYEDGDFSLSWHNTISYGLAWRMDDPNPDLIGLANGGNAFSVNLDDGNLNYATGLYSHAVKATTELELRWRNIGAFYRARGFYDIENEDGRRERTRLSDEALRRVGHRLDSLDAFVFWRFNLGNAPVELRGGEQVVSWGESTFIQNGINVINPVDVSALRVPGAELREALLPEGLVWASIGTSTNTSLELVYLYDWDDIEIDPPGSFFSVNDFAGDGGNTVFLAFGDVGDIPPFSDPLAPTRPFLGVSRGPDILPDDTGQYGAAFRILAPRLGDTEFGFYFLRYHSRLPVISGVTGTLAGALTAGAIGDPDPGDGGAADIIGTTLQLLAIGTNPPEAVAGGAAAAGEAVPTGAALGIAGSTAIGFGTALEQTGDLPTALAAGQSAGTRAASAFATDAYAQTAQYQIEYPEDIDLYGFSINTMLGRSGIALQGEISHRKDAPLQIDDVEILFAALGPISPGLAMTNQVGVFCLEERIQGYIRRDTWQAQATLTKVFGPMLAADQGVLLWEGAYSKVDDMPDKDTLRLDGPGTFTSGQPVQAMEGGAHAGKPAEAAEHFADDTSWGYRLAGRLDYNGAIGAINISPRFSWQHDVSGVSPGPGGNFIEDRKALTLGVAGSYQNSWEVDLSYTSFFGADRYNLINDRDFVALNAKYSF
ncbi:MAG: DUF1302 domain-containing protein [Acidobacteriota bacterium]|nr:MAG: DUF1302 domain-containing protein [Acidobacteriota bacterium]